MVAEFKLVFLTSIRVIDYVLANN